MKKKNVGITITDIDAVNNIKNLFTKLYIENQFTNRSEVFEHIILKWYLENQSIVLKNYTQGVSKVEKSKTKTFGFYIDINLLDRVNRDYGTGAVKRIILNWYYLTQNK